MKNHLNSVKLSICVTILIIFLLSPTPLIKYFYKKLSIIETTAQKSYKLMSYNRLKTIYSQDLVLLQVKNKIGYNHPSLISWSKLTQNIHRETINSLKLNHTLSKKTIYEIFNLTCTNSSYSTNNLSSSTITKFKCTVACKVYLKTNKITVSHTNSSILYKFASYATVSSEISSEGPDRTDIPAQPLIVEEKHWFPRLAKAQIIYSLLAIGVYIPYSSYYLAYFKVHVRIAGENDIYLRTLRIYLDQNKIYERIVDPGNEYQIDLDCQILQKSIVGYHELIFEITYGGYVEKGWKITSLWIEGSAAIVGEYFPCMAISKLEWEVICEPNTYLDISIKRVNDIYERTLEIYIDGILKRRVILRSDFCTSIYLGNYQKRTKHTLTIVIKFGGYTDRGWLLELNRIHYEALHIEVDYMPGHRPHDETLEYIETYYINHGYERIEFHIDDEIPLVETVDVLKYLGLASRYFDHSGQAMWKYCIFGHYADDKQVLGFTITPLPSTYFFIADQACDDYANDPINKYLGGVTELQVEKVVTMHELGHALNIIDYDTNGNEKYCENSYCVMAEVNWDNCNDSPFYCSHHWLERVSIKVSEYECNY